MEDSKVIRLCKILFAQSEMLDCILQEQAKIHNEVRNRSWKELQMSLADMAAFSDGFVNLDSRREALVGNNHDLYFHPEVRDLFLQVRTKLTKSKIENEALGKYVNTTVSFINGVIDQCVPQQRNTLYNKNGALVRPHADSVVLNAVM